MKSTQKNVTVIAAFLLKDATLEFEEYEGTLFTERKKYLLLAPEMSNRQYTLPPSGLDKGYVFRPSNHNNATARLSVFALTKDQAIIAMQKYLVKELEDLREKRLAVETDLRDLEPFLPS